MRESNKEKKQRNDTINEAKKIKSDNFTKSNKEKSNIAIALLKKIMLGWHHHFSNFGGTNNIFAEYTYNRIKKFKKVAMNISDLDLVWQIQMILI